MTTDWSTIAAAATAGGTLVLAVATFVSVRQGNRATRISERAARVAEQALLAGRRPLLMNSRLQDPKQRVEFKGGDYFDVLGGRATIRATDSVVYLAISIRNVGTGVAVLHGWYLIVGVQYERVHPPLEEFTTQNLDIYIAPGDTGYWEGACRDPDADDFKAVTAAVETGGTLVVDLLYGDYEGGQRVISQFNLVRQDDNWIASVVRHFNVDRPDPR
jgi:hypothetical protein